MDVFASSMPSPLSTRYAISPFQHPFTCIIAGPSGSGKTKLLLDILNTPNIIEAEPQRIVYCYGAWQKQFSQLKNIEFVEGLPELDRYTSPLQQRKLIILDDLMDEANGSESIQHLFTRGSHHYNISVFLLTQNIFNQGKFARTININSHYTILFDNPRDRTQIRYLAREIHPENPRFLQEAYIDAARLQPHGYIFIDNKQATADEIRIQTKITNPVRIVYKMKNIY